MINVDVRVREGEASGTLVYNATVCVDVWSSVHKAVDVLVCERVKLLYT